MPKNFDLLKKLRLGTAGDCEFKVTSTAILERLSFDDLARRAMDIAESRAYVFRSHVAPAGKGLIDSLFILFPN